LVISFARTGSLRVEEVASGKQRLHKALAADYAQGLALSSDGTHVAVTTSRKLYVWKWQTEEPRELKGPERVDGIAFSPDDSLLAVVSESPGRLHVYDMPSGKLRYERASTDKEMHRYAFAPTFTPDGKTLAVSLFGSGREAHGRIDLLDPGAAARA